MAMDDRAKAAFSTAVEVVKNVLTLSTGVLVLGMTFTKELSPNPTLTQVRILEASWCFLFLAMLFGVLTLMALTGTIGKTSQIAASSIYNRNIRIPMGIQFIFFLAGIALTVAYAMLAV
jgi:hypothetical protein